MKLTPSVTPRSGPASRIVITWHEQEDLAELLHENIVLEEPSIMEWWRQQWVPPLEAIHHKLGRKFNLLVCIDGLSIRAAVADEYGATAKSVTSRLCSRVARYGHASTVRPIIATEALKKDYKANLFDNRAAAVRFLRG